MPERRDARSVRTGTIKLLHPASHFQCPSRFEEPAAFSVAWASTDVLDKALADSHPHTHSNIGFHACLCFTTELTKNTEEIAEGTQNDLNAVDAEVRRENIFPYTLCVPL